MAAHELTPRRRGPGLPPPTPASPPQPGAAARRVGPARARHGPASSTGADPLERFVHLLDSQFRIPVLGVRFGIDPILGLIPGVGDLVGSLLGLAVLTQARREGASAATLARMAGNLLIDLALGAVPLVGDVADAWYKANRRNLRLLQDDRARRGRT